MNMRDQWETCDAEFVSGLKLLDCATLSLSEALKLKPVDGTTNCFEGYLPPDWCSTASTGHGGTTITYIQAATREYFRLRYPSLSQPDAINLQVQFISLVSVGPLFFEIKDVKLGRRVSIVQVEVKARDADGKLSTRTAATVTQGNLSKETGVTWKDPGILGTAVMPPRHLCKRWADAWWMNSMPASQKFRSYIPVGGPDLHFPDRFGPGIRECWQSIDDGSGWDVLLLGSVCDPLGAVPISFGDPADGPKHLLNFRYPTVSMMVEIKKDPKGAKWLFARTKLSQATRGRFNVDVTVMDEGGEVVAISRLMSLNLEKPEVPPMGKL